MTELRLGRFLGPAPGGAVALVLGRSGSGIALPDPRPGRVQMAVSAPWRPAASAPPTGLSAPWRPATGLGAAWVAPWGPGAPAAGVFSVPWASTQAVQPAHVAALWDARAALAVNVAVPWGGRASVGAEVLVPWLPAPVVRSSIAVPWDAGLLVARQHALFTWQAATGASVRVTSSATSAASAMPARVRAPWQVGRLVESIGGPLEPPVPPPAPTPCWVPEDGGSVDLVLRQALRLLGELVLSCRRASIRVVPVRRVYMVTNVTTLVRVSDGTPIPCNGFSLSLDVDSWAWGFSASLPATALSLIEPSTEGEPVELLAGVNGTSFRLIVESMARERTFGQASMRVQGRGRTALLDAPYSALQTFSAASALTTQQLIDQALPSGWTATYGLTPWLVPGGVWSHQGTPITAALAVAAAGGGYVQPHRTDTSLTVLPRYPSAPWSWASVTPDLELPAAVVTREGIEWVERARYNRVYVSGTNTGVLGRVTRAGSAGDVVAQMVTDALITHVDGARQRGLPVLAEGGRKALVTLRLPVLVETGVVTPGQFVRYVDGGTSRIGLVRSVALDVAFPEVWQSIKVETHVN